MGIRAETLRRMDMKYTKLGKSALRVSRICMGCMGFGDAKNGQHTWTIDETHSREIIEERYTPHPLVGVMVQNTVAAAKKAHVWSIGNQRI